MSSKPQIFSSGITTLDCALGGGWAVGHVANLFGLESCGKTLLMIEAAAQFAKKFPGSPMRLVDAEAAFDDQYAASIGYPVDVVQQAEPGAVQTIEDLYDDLFAFANKIPKGKCGMYMLDSLDALSSQAEMARDIGASGYKTEKVQAISQLFRRIIALLQEKNIIFMVISQMRVNPAAKPGTSPYTETGGTALKFYAYQRLKVKKIKLITKTIAGEERTTGIKVQAEVKKNKLAAPFRTADFPIVFGFGVDNLASNIEWLASHKQKAPKGKEKEYPDGISFLNKIPGSDDVKTVSGFLGRLQKLEGQAFKDMIALIDQTVRKCDDELSEGFKPAKSRNEGGFEALEEISEDPQMINIQDGIE